MLSRNTIRSGSQGLVSISIFAKMYSSASKQTMKALVIDGNKARLDKSRQIPKLRDDSLIVRPLAVALNPTDWRHIRYRRAADGCIIGCDYAGIVESVGKAVTKDLKPGDRVFGCGHGANLVNPDDGVFSEYASVIGDLQMRVPTSLSLEAAATIGLGAGTVGQGLFQKSLKLQLPKADGRSENKGTTILIYGGGTATGSLGIQFAKLAGYTVATVCSQSDFGNAKILGADMVFDYNEVNVGGRIREETDNKIRHAWDTVSIESSARICADALTDCSSLAPVYGTLLPVKSPRSDVSSVATVLHTVYGRAFQFGDQHMPASVEDFNFAKQFYRLTEGLVELGLLRPHKHHVGRGGLKGVIQGLADLEAGKIRGRKLVYRVKETT